MDTLPFFRALLAYNIIVGIWTSYPVVNGLSFVLSSLPLRLLRRIFRKHVFALSVSVQVRNIRNVSMSRLGFQRVEACYDQKKLIMSAASGDSKGFWKKIMGRGTVLHVRRKCMSRHIGVLSCCLMHTTLRSALCLKPCHSSAVMPFFVSCWLGVGNDTRPCSWCVCNMHFRFKIVKETNCAVFGFRRFYAYKFMLFKTLNLIKITENLRVGLHFKSLWFGLLKFSAWLGVSCCPLLY